MGASLQLTNKCISPLSTQELKLAEHYWIKIIQHNHLQEELESLKKQVPLCTCACFICRRDAVKPQPQMLGQLPIERITPGTVFDKLGVDYTGPVYIKY